jgi:hypothetical protein
MWSLCSDFWGPRTPGTTRGARQVGADPAVWVGCRRRRAPSPQPTTHSRGSTLPATRIFSVLCRDGVRQGGPEALSGCVFLASSRDLGW